MAEFNTVQSFDLDGFRGELLVAYEYDIKHYPERVEETHGSHYFNEDEIINVNITSVELVIKGVGIDVTNFLSKEQLTEITNGLNIW